MESGKTSTQSMKSKKNKPVRVDEVAVRTGMCLSDVLLQFPEHEQGFLNLIQHQSLLEAVVNCEFLCFSGCLSF